MQLSSIIRQILLDEFYHSSTFEESSYYIIKWNSAPVLQHIFLDEIYHSSTFEESSYQVEFGVLRNF